MVIRAVQGTLMNHLRKYMMLLIKEMTYAL